MTHVASRQQQEQEQRRNPQLRWWLLWTVVGFAVAFVFVLVLVIGPPLLVGGERGGLSRELWLKAQNDARTALVQAFVGLAVASGAVVTFRTFLRNRVEQDRTYELQHSEQVNEFFTKAVEQLGHEHAAVRLGALYSLIQLAQDNVSRRQPVIDVVCAYLRMPPPHSPEADESAGTDLEAISQAQELEVRKTAQRLLADHLRPPEDVSGEDAQRVKACAEQEFWPGMSLDLTGATLVNPRFDRVSVRQADFDRATFIEYALFDRATFTGNAGFYRATFAGLGSFGGAVFKGSAQFTEATFARGARFVRRTTGPATFYGDAHFLGATFGAPSLPEEEKAVVDAMFERASFMADVSFAEALFIVDARFSNTDFARNANFASATFNRGAWFRNAAFTGKAMFKRVTFKRAVNFEGAKFTVDEDFLGARVQGDSSQRVWPNGWWVRLKALEQSRGHLVRTTKESADDVSPQLAGGGNDPSPA
jgi:uncharacterized protein YjbI with pentapeptide repeats